jgi:hypothetical protein
VQEVSSYSDAVLVAYCNYENPEPVAYFSLSTGLFISP